MTEAYVVYGAQGSGSVAVEAALTLIGAPYRVVELAPFDSEDDAEAMGKVNPMRQVPALVLPGGELMTESAAILVYLAETYPEAKLSPQPGSPLRPRFLRWMSYISAQIYALYWGRDDTTRLADEPAHQALVLARTEARILDCWAAMADQVGPTGAFLLGEELSVLDLYLAVVSRWGPRRRAFSTAAPRLGDIARRVDAEPRLSAFWAERFPFEPGWDQPRLPAGGAAS